jgi:hypothetical protein
MSVCVVAVVPIVLGSLSCLYLFLLSYSPDNLQTLELSSFQCHIVAYIDPG